MTTENLENRGSNETESSLEAIRNHLVNVIDRTKLHWDEAVIADTRLIVRNLQSFSREELERILEGLYNIEKSFSELSNSLDDYRTKGK